VVDEEVDYGIRETRQLLIGREPEHSCATSS